MRFLPCILFNLFWIKISAQPTYPVDISYLVSDIKYSHEHGVKICEVQHGALSALSGDLYLSGEEGSISPMVAAFFTPLPMKKWAVGITYPPLKRSLIATEWASQDSIKTLLKDPIFLKCAALPPMTPFSITSYSGIFYGDYEIVQNSNSYYTAHPGVLFVDAAILPYWGDKYKMNALFELNIELKTYKAEWRLYPKKYDRLLSETIQEEMPSELYVIKPRREFLAAGVIVVANKDLDGVLQMILEPSPSLQKHPDKKYSYWWRNKEDTFLIEKYYKSDPLWFSIPISEKISGETENITRVENESQPTLLQALDLESRSGYHYDATMRLAFILQYDEGKMTYHSLGGFWKLPSKASEEEGSLNEKMISCCRPPFYKAVDPELLKEVNAQMERAMLLLYEKMLHKQP